MTPAIFRCFRLSPHHFISLRNINKLMEIFHKLGSTNYHKLCREGGGAPSLAEFWDQERGQRYNGDIWKIK